MLVEIGLSGRKCGREVVIKGRVTLRNEVSKPRSASDHDRRTLDTISKDIEGASRSFDDGGGIPFRRLLIRLLQGRSLSPINSTKIVLDEYLLLAHPQFGCH